MRALSYRQPWAWALLHAGKDIENRVWRRKLEGRVLIHAAQGCTVDEYTAARNFICERVPDAWARMPKLVDIKGGRRIVRGLGSATCMPQGGIVGVLTFTGEIVHDNSLKMFLRDYEPPQWWMPGQYGYVVRDAKPLPFMPWKGSLGVFDVPDDALERAYGAQWREMVS